MNNLLYQTHFGLSQAPFNITPDPSFLYLSASHREGLAQLSYGVRAKKGFVVLTGEVGTGKTTLIHALLNELDRSCQTGLIFSTIVSPADLLRSVCEEFGLIDPKRPPQEIHDYLVSLNEFLLESYRGGENCVLIIDEAQNLSAEVLESIRLLSNFETSKDKLLQIILVGQPELAVRLNSPELRQLKQRVMLRHHLRALSLQECCDYVCNRLKVAGGGDQTIFTAAALESIHSYSSGIPRIINVLCDNALLTGYALGRQEIDPGIIREVAEDLSIGVNADARFKPIRQVVSANGKALEQRFSARSVETRPETGRLEPKLASVKPTSKEQTFMAFLPASFLDHMITVLTDAMGPMAKIVLREQMKALGESSANFPYTKVEMLIDSVSQEILDEGMRGRFQKQMREQIRTLQAS